MAALVLVVVAAPVAVEVLGDSAQPRDPAAHDARVVLATASTMFAIFFISSLVDWFYIRPRRDGLVWHPPCCDPGGQWFSVTRTWLRNRLICDVAFFLFFPVTGLLLLVAFGADGSTHSLVTKAIGFLIGLASLGFGYLKTRVSSGMAAVGRSGLPFVLGDTIDWTVPLESLPGRLRHRVYRFPTGRELRVAFGKPRGSTKQRWVSGRDAFVFDVSSHDSQMIYPGSKKPNQRLPISELFKAGAVVVKPLQSYCGAQPGGCTRLHAECERDLKRR